MSYLKEAGDTILGNIKHQTFFPFKSGNLRFNATSGQLIDQDTYLIRIDGNIASYAQFLEEGTSPHDIPGAFGRPEPFGIGGRFNGFFHPGSKKHKGFVERICRYITRHWKKVYYGARILMVDHGDGTE